MTDDDREKLGGVKRGEITIPGTLRVTCVSCEDRRFFSPDHNTDTGLRYSCDDCGHEIALALNPE